MTDVDIAAPRDDAARLADARRVADAILFEGYILYPYRATSAKNQLRWQFGMLGPIGAAQAGAGEESGMRATLLIEPEPDTAPRFEFDTEPDTAPRFEFDTEPDTAPRFEFDTETDTAPKFEFDTAPEPEPDVEPKQESGSEPKAGTGPSVDLTLRFLHPQFRSVERTSGTGFEPVESLSIGGVRWVPWHEAVVCEVPLPGITSDTVIPIEIAGGHDIEPLYDDGRLAGRLVRTRERLRGRVRVSWRSLDAARPLLAVDIEVTNRGRWDRSPAADAPRTAARDLAARTSFAGAHLVARAEGGRFLSLTDPPDWASGAAAATGQHRCWPVLLGTEGGPDDLVLVSPIILSDRPAVAPESAGDFFDATEIDEMLALRVRTLTDDEKAQARGTDPRAAEIVDRCDSMTDETLAGLHGTVRDPAPSVFDQPDTPWWDPEADASVCPESDTVHIAGVPVGKGSTVRLHPLRRADAQDMFLAGRSATVAAVLCDVDGATHVAVTLDDDPGNDLHAWYGRFHYFAPEELEPLP